jgi:hypothetical protein
METILNDITAEISGLLEEAYAYRINNLKKSIELGEKALAMSRKAGNKALTAKSMSRLSLFHMIRGEYDESLKMGEGAIAAFSELKDDKGVAEAKYNIAGIYYKTDNCHMGLVYLIDSVGIYRNYEDWHNVSRCEKSLGTIYEYFGDQKSAVKSYENALEAAQKAGDLNLEANVYNPLSGICLKQGETGRAMELAEKAIQIKKDAGDLRGLAFSIYGRGKVYASLGMYDRAERDYVEALGIHSNMGERLGLAMVYQKLGILYLRNKNYDKARETLQRGVRFSSEYKIAIIRFKCLHALYELCKEMGETKEALQYLEKYLREKECVINTQTMKVIENYELITRVERMEKESQMQREKAEIVAKMVRAEQSAKVKQEFLSTMSHEIRTPLNAVLTIAGMLPDREDAEEKKLLDSLRFAANNLLYIINDILDFTSLESGKVRIENAPADLYSLLGKIKETYRAMAETKGLKIELLVDDDARNIYDLDETKLAQVLGNLISNAIKYTEMGEVDIEVEIMKSKRSHDVLRFMVKDTGEGISQEYLGTIFDSFSVSSNITKRKQGGTGLGLAIVKKLLELFGSDIHVNSKIGEGSTFFFDLELRKVQKPVANEEPAEFTLKGKRVLLAEDNPMNAFVATKLLTTWGMDITHAKNGQEAIDEALLSDFDFILMDIHMPLMNGYEATEYIRTHANPNRDKPIFALTADITAMQEERYVPLFNTFLWKPLEVKKLYDALATSQLELVA